MVTYQNYTKMHGQKKILNCVYRRQILIQSLLSSGMSPCSLVPVYYCFGEISWLHIEDRMLSMEATNSFCWFKTSYQLTRRLLPQNSSKLLLNVIQEFTFNICESGLNCNPRLGAIHMWKRQVLSKSCLLKTGLDFFPQGNAEISPQSHREIFRIKMFEIIKNISFAFLSSDKIWFAILFM